MAPTRDFTYLAADNLTNAVTALADGNAAALGGGTDLLVEIEEQLRSPAALVDVRRLPELQGVAALTNGSLRIGAAVTLATLERAPVVLASYGTLAKACAAAASSALRNMGTLGGNLCQRPRCWYFRRGVRCYKRGGNVCPAVDGANQHLGILGGGPCHAVHPSDPAVALTALDARLEVARTSGSRELAIADLYAVPNADATRETTLSPGELIVAIELPAEAAGGMHYYDKATQREAWDFALVSLAAVKRRDGAVRLVLGGVAARPWRVNESVEEDVASGGLSDDDYGTLADRALYDVTPLSQNGYKVTLAAALLRRGMRALHSS
ncbi:MAG: FAD binding domain-containing protein [Gemmatimonadaceae bacterium]